MNLIRIFKWITLLYIFFLTVFAQESNQKFVDFSSVKKRVYNFTKVEFITTEGEFNDAICTLLLPGLSEDSPPLVDIYYKKTNLKT